MRNQMRNRLRPRSVPTLALAGVTVLLIASVSVPPPGSELAQADRPVLSDDDGDAPLLEIGALAPGDRVVRCIRVRHRGEAAARVRLGARAEGRLARDVTLTVARGEGGGFDDCADFDGEVVFRGSLAEAGAADAAVRAWSAGARDETTYRFIVAAPRDLTDQGAKATAAFRWTASAEEETDGDGQDNPPDDGTDNTPGGDPTPPAEPTPTPPAADPSPAATPAATAVAAVTGRPPGGRDGGPRAPQKDKRPTDRKRRADDAGSAAPAPAPVPPADPNAGSDGRDRGGLGQTLGRVAEAVREAVVTVAKRAAFPMLLMIAMALFLVFQNRLDRRDPKLALAPVKGAPDLPFTDPGDLT